MGGVHVGCVHAGGELALLLLPTMITAPQQVKRDFAHITYNHHRLRIYLCSTLCYAPVSTSMFLQEGPWPTQAQRNPLSCYIQQRQSLFVSCCG